MILRRPSRLTRIIVPCLLVVLHCIGAIRNATYNEAEIPFFFCTEGHSLEHVPSHQIDHQIDDRGNKAVKCRGPHPKSLATLHSLRSPARKPKIDPKNLNNLLFRPNYPPPCGQIPETQILNFDLCNRNHIISFSGENFNGVRGPSHEEADRGSGPLETSQV